MTRFPVVLKKSVQKTNKEQIKKYTSNV